MKYGGASVVYVEPLPNRLSRERKKKKKEKENRVSKGNLSWL